MHFEHVDPHFHFALSPANDPGRTGRAEEAFPGGEIVAGGLPGPRNLLRSRSLALAEGNRVSEWKHKQFVETLVLKKKLITADLKFKCDWAWCILPGGLVPCLPSHHFIIPGSRRHLRSNGVWAGRQPPA